MSIRVGVVRLCLKGVPRVHAVIYIYATKEQKEHKMVLTITKKKVVDKDVSKDGP